MKSFDPLARPAGEGPDGDEAFTPLCPSGPPRTSTPEGWRPLFEEQVVPEPAGGADEPARAGGHSQATTPPAEPPAAEEPAPGASADGRTFEEGYELGRRETQADVEAAARSLVEALQSVSAFRLELRHRYERELLELALGVARKVLHTELRQQPETWLAMIRDAVARVVDREMVRVRVPGPLATYLKEQLPRLRSKLEDVKDLEILDDPALTEGGCVIETVFGEVDMGIDTQVDQIRSDLTRVG